MSKIPRCLFWIIIVLKVYSQCKSANVGSLEKIRIGPIVVSGMLEWDTIHGRLHLVLLASRRRVGTQTTNLLLDPILSRADASIDAEIVGSSTALAPTRNGNLDAIGVQNGAARITCNNGIEKRR